MFEQQFNILIDPGYLLDANRKNLPMTPDTYVSSVRNVISEILKSQTGKVILHTISLWHGWVRISPPDVDVACPGATTDRASDTDLFRYKLTRDATWLPEFVRRPVKSVILFVPQHWAFGGGCHKKYTDKSYSDYVSSDYAPTVTATLLHELVHSVRFVSKTFVFNAPDSFPGTRLNAYDSEEEFNAVLVENIYQSETKANIRNSHHGFNTLEAGLQDSFEFFKVSKKAFYAVDKFCRANPHFTRRLCAIKVPFNPIAAYYHDKRKCEAFSKTIDAARRDNVLVQLFSLLTPGFPPNAWDKLLS